MTSDPVGAEVYVDGRLFGDTPATVKLAPGLHTIQVTLAGYGSWSRTIATQAGADAHFLAPLVKTTPATVRGRVLWNDQPVAGLNVLLKQSGPALGVLGSGTTDAAGQFAIANVPGGTGYYLDVTSNQPTFSSDSMFPVQVAADGSPLVKDIFVCKPLLAISPRLGQVVGGHHVTVAWQPFPEAVGYSIRIWKLGADRQYVEVYSRGSMLEPDLREPGLQVEADLPAGQYFWRADAFSRSPHPIGCSFAPETFTVK